MHAGVPAAQPTHAAPVPSVDHPPTYQQPVPTQAPTFKPPVADPKPHGIADPISGGYSGDHAMLIVDHPTYTDHGTLAVAAGGGLSGGLMPESTMAETHHLVPVGHDISL